ncbi:MAG: SCP-2 sterol transfer family protein [Gammaproteobacteria bacterium]|nr:SCP-2 sterol transfer family protein [Gammaproteobacteria bacterium]MCW8922715.1 SCP-2 sterol transfer family protein [Gammaproteobacteria bacterium]
MSELFSKEWGQAYMDAWNADQEITSTLQQAGFNSIVAFGFQEEDAPHFVMTIKDGLVTSVEDQPENDINWDIRATRENWLALIAKPPGLMKLGIAYTSRKMRFKKGDYATMIKDPSLAGAFVKSFGLMSKVS